MGGLVGKGESSGSARRGGCSRCLRRAGPAQSSAVVCYLLLRGVVHRSIHSVQRL